jgi:DNA polymerase-3 subunit delta'
MWNKITGQHRVKNILKNIISGGKHSHAYIFEGKEGTGKDAVAIEFAKILNCNEPVNGIEACDKCKNCIEISGLRSPLLNFIFALPAGKNESENDRNPLEKLSKDDYNSYLEAVSLKAGNPYYRISLPKANTIRINSIRQILNEASLTGKTGKKKFFVISNADMMNPQSANSLLKVLEEPPVNTILILTTSKPNSLLPTITGRCQTIRFDKIKTEYIKEYLLKINSSLNDHDAEFYSELSDGSITRAESIINKDYLELRENVVEMLNFAMKSSFIKFEDHVSKLCREKNKEKLKEFLFLMLIYFRDLMFAEAGNLPQIVNKDKTERIEKTVKHFDIKTYEIMNLIEEAARNIDNNLFADLLFYNLFLNIRSLINRKPSPV